MLDHAVPMMKVEVAPTQFGKPLIVYVSLINPDQGVINECIVEDSYRLSILAKEFTPEVILDVGGHIGTFGLLAKSYWPNARLIALEPNPITHFLYIVNMKVNGITNYSILNKALSYDPQACVLLGTAPGCSFLRTPKEADKYLKEGLALPEGKYNRQVLTPTDFTVSNSKVETVTIEELFEEYEIDKVDLAKWDCEGGEVEVFKSMSDEAASKFKYMCGEHHIQDAEGIHLKGTIWEFADFAVTTERKFPHLQLKATPQYPVGLFWARPREGYTWVMEAKGLIDFGEVPKRILEAIEQKSLNTLSERKRYEELFNKEKEDVKVG